MQPSPNCLFASNANDIKEEHVLDVANNDAVSAVGLYGAQPVKGCIQFGSSDIQGYIHVHIEGIDILQKLPIWTCYNKYMIVQKSFV